MKENLKLYHVSEESDIKIFEPRLPMRKDLDPEVGIVWAIIKRNVEIRIVDNLWNIAEKVKSSSLNYSLCRMGYAKK